MKKYIAITALSISVAVLSIIAGCDPQSSSDSSTLSSTTTSTSSESSTTTPEIPKGEPTFLICPDGTPVYTSEISEIYAGSEFYGNLETLALEQAERRAKDCEGEFNIKCEGFAYGFIPQKALNRIDNPELFQKDSVDLQAFHYLGEEDESSDECMRIEVGDKFGPLTVKSVYTLFGDKSFLEEFSQTPGAYISGGAIVFDGEIELTGYVDVWEDTDYQGAGGTMLFFPDGDSSVKIPVIPRDVLSHTRESNSSGYFGDWWCSLGNMSEVRCDTSSLHKGDVFVKVKITAENVTSGQGGVRLELKSIEVL